MTLTVGQMDELYDYLYNRNRPVKYTTLFIHLKFSKEEIGDFFKIIRGDEDFRLELKLDGDHVALTDYARGRMKSVALDHERRARIAIGANANYYS